MIKILNFLLVCMMILSCQKQKDPYLILPVKKIINTDAKNVEKVLGTPDSTYTRNIAGKYYYVQLYKSHLTEIRHYNGRAEQIILNRPWDLPYKPELIERFGIKYRLPDRLEKDAIINWKDIEGFTNVSFYLVGSPKPDTVSVNYKIFFTVEK